MKTNVELLDELIEIEKEIDRLNNRRAEIAKSLDFSVKNIVENQSNLLNAHSVKYGVYETHGLWEVRFRYYDKNKNKRRVSSKSLGMRVCDFDKSEALVAAKAYIESIPFVYTTKKHYENLVPTDLLRCKVLVEELEKILSDRG